MSSVKSPHFYALGGLKHKDKQGKIDEPAPNGLPA